MPTVDLWALVEEERASLLGTYEALTPEQWDAPSLCGSWTVRQLLGHLIVAADVPMLGFMVAVVKAGGSFDRAQDSLARAEAERPPAELLARYRDRLANRRTPPGFGPSAPLTDILVHSLDVRLPLGLPSERPAERYAPALGLLFDRRGQAFFVPKGRPSLRWVATDHPWSHGTGEELQGTMADLTLAASGRSVRLDALTGAGMPALATWAAR